MRWDKKCSDSDGLAAIPRHTQRFLTAIPLHSQRNLSYGNINYLNITKLS
jgi:hypothetical protein